MTPIAATAPEPFYKLSKYTDKWIVKMKMAVPKTLKTENKLPTWVENFWLRDSQPNWEVQA